jgi:integrase
MSVYSKKGKGWRYDFTLTGQRYTEAWFPNKRDALAAEAKRKEELRNPEFASPQGPEPVAAPKETPTGMGFLELVNLRLDHVKAYNSDAHYSDHIYLAKRWVKMWGKLACSEITRGIIEKFVLQRARVSAYVANKEIRYLRATFNFGKKRGYVKVNPADGIDFLPLEKRVKYVPSPEDIDKVIAAADPDTQDYLWTIRETLARVSEINRLTWDEVNLEQRYVILYTRKKKGGHLTPRKVPMTQKLYEILSRRKKERDTSKPWVFLSTHYDRKSKCWMVGREMEGSL